MKETKRALRRHHRQRMIRHALRSYAIGYCFLGDDDEKREFREERARRLHDYLTKCSCWMCGNPRKFFKEVTVQEKRLAEAARYELSVNGR
jgi:hypothetical protein